MMTWKVCFYQDKDSGKAPLREWLEDLATTQEAKHLAALAAIERVLKVHGTDVCETEWGKNLGKGLYEFRVRHPAASIRAMFPLPGDAGSEEAEAKKDIILLRIFFTTYGEQVLLLCSGYDKGTDPSEHRQGAEIRRARELVGKAQAAMRARKKTYGA
jgi:putative component of toxin-antitoxin plasmid stabilization module